MKDFNIQQLKDAMIELYNKKDDASGAAYRLAFDMLESKMDDDDFDQFLDAYNI